MSDGTVREAIVRFSLGGRLKGEGELLVSKREKMVTVYILYSF